MNLIVRNEKPVPAPEPFEKRVAKAIAENNMEGWSDADLDATSNDYDSPLQQAAAFILRRRGPQNTDPHAWIW